MKNKPRYVKKSEANKKLSQSSISQESSQKIYQSQKNLDHLSQSNAFHQKNQKQTSKLSKSISVKQLKISNFDSDQDSDQQFNLEFDDKKFLHLWLVGILPDSDQFRCKYDLHKRKIIGNQFECQKKLSQCQQHLQNYKMKLVSNLQDEISRNMELYLKISQVKVFGKVIVQKACQEIQTRYNYKKILQIFSKIQGNYFYLFSLKNQLQKRFLLWFDQNKMSEITRTDIQRIQGRPSIFLCQQYKKQSKQSTNNQKSPKPFSKFKQLDANKQPIPKIFNQSLSKDEQKQSFVQESSQNSEQDGNPNGFYGFDQNSLKASSAKTQIKLQKQQSKKDKYPPVLDSQMYNKKKVKYVKKDYKPADEDFPTLIRSRQVLLTLLEQIFPVQIFKVDRFKSWVVNNKNLSLDDVNIKQQDQNVIVSLLGTSTGTNQNQKKKEAINIYFKFSKPVLLVNVSKQGVSRLQQNFCKKSKSYIKCKIIQGYKAPQTHEHKLRSMILQNRIQRSYRNSQKFYAVWLQGLKPQVERIQQQIRDYLLDLPKQNKIQIIRLNIPQIQQYLYHIAVEQFAKKVIKQYFKDSNKFVLNEVVLSGMKLSINIGIKYDYYDSFTAEKKQKLIKQIQKCFNVTQLFKQQDMLDELKDKYLIVPSETKKGMMVLIESQSKAASTSIEIMNIIRENRENIKNVQISFKKGRLQMLKNFIDSIESDKNSVELLKNITFTFQGQNKIKIIGTSKNINNVASKINQYLDKIQQNTLEKILILDQSETLVVEKNMQKFKKQIESTYKLSFNLSKDIQFGATVILGASHAINSLTPFIAFIQKHNQISRLPKQTVVFFHSQRDINFSNEKMLLRVKAFFSTQNKFNLNKMQIAEKQLTFMYRQGIQYIQTNISLCLNNYPYKDASGHKNFGFVMPKKAKPQFLLKIIQTFENILAKQKIRVYILQESIEDTKNVLIDLSGRYNNQIQVTKYYVWDQKQFYYSASGDQKINKALQNKLNKVQLVNQDLNLQHITHKCSLKNKKVVHCQSGKQSNIIIGGNKCYIQLDVNHYQMPQKIYKKVIQQSKTQEYVDVSLGFYELDFVKMKQINLFSKFERDIKKKVVKVQNKRPYKIFVKSDQKVNQIQIPFDPKQQENAIKASEKLISLIQAQKHRIQFKLPKVISNDQFNNIYSIASQNDVVVQWDGIQTLTLSSFDKISIARLQKNIIFFLQSHKVQLPQNWQPQTKQIQTFVVSKKSKQFQQVQKVFTVGEIKQLLRIQNKLVYKKYNDEKICLADLNGGKKVKQMMLFHGTKMTDPKLIYEDKQQSFNINYTSDNNYLGRGTYFAVRPQYSHNYAHKSNERIQQGIMEAVYSMFSSQTIYQMFYCSVLVGDSQEVKVIDANSMGMKDTTYKNVQQKIRYQSSTTFTNNSTIYAVYKNRRAYPLYLIKYAKS